MQRYAQVIHLIYEAIDEVNPSLPPEQTLEKSPETVLIGASGKLDSLGFVNLITLLEEKLKRSLSRDISLIDVMAPAEDGQRTVASLGKSIAELLRAKPREGKSALASTGF